MTQEQVNAYLARQREGAHKLAATGKAVEREADLHDQILAECRRRGWIALHGRMDLASGRTIGEPDFVLMADNGRVLFIECKTKAGKIRPEQQALHAWAARLEHTVHVVRSLVEFMEIAK